MNDTRLARWHAVVFNQDMATLSELLADEVEFHSPTVWKPKLGKDVTQYILQMIIDIFEDFEYQREWINDNNFALEFSAKVDGKNLKGIDLIRWNDEGKIIHFEVMLRPINGLQLVLDKMTKRVQDCNKVKANLSAWLNRQEWCSEVFASDANFVLFRCTSPSEKVRIFDLLVNKNILIRDQSKQLQLENCLRISIGSEQEITQLKEVLS